MTERKSKAYITPKASRQVAPPNKMYWGNPQPRGGGGCSGGADAWGRSGGADARGCSGSAESRGRSESAELERAPGTERALERTLWAPGTERAL